MAVSPALRRLLRIRELNEEQHRLALEAALNELDRLEKALNATAGRDARGLRLVASSARSGELADRLAGLEESRAAARHAASLAPRIGDSRDDVATLREQFLAVRVARRQAETLVVEAQAREAIEATRRSQQAVDDWFGSRRHREKAAAEPPDPDPQSNSSNNGKT
jgi:hypothetical protein